MRDKDIKLYNMILPPFMLFMFSPVLWMLSLAGNFVIDSVVLLIITLVIFKEFDSGFFRKVILKVWLLGFLADFVGVFYLTAIAFLTSSEYPYSDSILNHILGGIYSAVNGSHFDSIWGVLFIVSGMLVASACIFIFDYFISFKNTGLSKKQRVISSLVFAVVTSPYTFLLPKELFY